MASHDPTRLPEGLPVPVDDGAAAHLPGLDVPVVRLASTAGREIDVAELATARLVLFVYPSMGRPGVPMRPGWDDIPGARGCTPQSCSFRDRFDEFERRGLAVAGLSTQAVDEQAEAAQRLHLPYPLLSDPRRELGEALRLPTFSVGDEVLYKRMSLVIEDGRIAKVFYPVFPPDRDAANVLAWLAGD
jgi:peroxiredoxin